MKKHVVKLMPETNGGLTMLLLLKNPEGCVKKSMWGKIWQITAPTTDLAVALGKSRE